ncbi:hypothetical protein [Nocardia cyriacigeorgica]|uniref:hypothetical protein n=1 Tax=Nocardia cyriacigeorgica TaxID=135487 RepID=UPI002458F270|nr:hypothetical protein [Nocardia cyriacigeorgica]
MSDRTQDKVTDALSAEIAGSGHWPGLGGMLLGLIASLIAGAISAILGGFATVLDAIFGTVTDDYIAQMPIINDHTQQLEDLTAAIEQTILQGDAWVFLDGETWTPTEGVLFLEVILIGAGAGGGGGRGDAIPANRGGGGGGGGGGEVHYKTIPANLLPKDPSGNFLPLQIGIGTGGSGGAANNGANAFPGVGGGNSTIDTAIERILTAGGGQGGTGATHGGAGGIGGQGGAGMVIGGNGGNGGGGTVDEPSSAGTHSTSQYELNGGGGGGGGGGGNAIAGVGAGQPGGVGGISPGGTPGLPGEAPSSVVATGGGGGGGGHYTAAGGAGAMPAGGGGGGGENAPGGNGGNGICFIIERFV